MMQHICSYCHKPIKNDGEGRFVNGSWSIDWLIDAKYAARWMHIFPCYNRVVGENLVNRRERKGND